MDQDTTDEALYSPASPMVQATGDIEQPTNLGSTDQLQRRTNNTGNNTPTTPGLLVQI